MRARPSATLPLLVFLVAPLVAVACGGEAGKQAGTTTTTAATTTTTAAPPPKPIPVRAYYLRDGKVGPVARLSEGAATASGAIDALLGGPTAEERELNFSTAIPSGTVRRSVSITNGIATVDLSREFAAGGGSASMQGRVAQVVFTLTQFPAVDAVEFEIEGVKVTALGGEGLLLEVPQRRSDWEDLAPAILVESPLPFAEVASPLRILGTANTFEATFHVTVIDAGGQVVYDRYATATSGTGTRGTFDLTASLRPGRSGLASLVVFEYSAEDGRRIHSVEIPVRL